MWYKPPTYHIINKNLYVSYGRYSVYRVVIGLYPRFTLWLFGLTLIVSVECNGITKRYLSQREARQFARQVENCCYKVIEDLCTVSVCVCVLGIFCCPPRLLTWLANKSCRWQRHILLTLSLSLSFSLSLYILPFLSLTHTDTYETCRWHFAFMSLRCKNPAAHISSKNFN